MAYIEGEGRSQGTLFPVVLDDLVPPEHMCRVIDAFVEQLEMAKLGFERAQPPETGRRGYDPRALPTEAAQSGATMVPSWPKHVRVVRAEGIEPPRPVRGCGSSYHFGFRRPTSGGFVIWTIPSPSLARVL